MKRRYQATLALVLALSVPTAAFAADYSDWLGTWVGVWTEGRGRTELRIDRIDERRNIHGAICQF